MKTLRDKFEQKPWDIYGELVGEKFKEEVSDVFSWLAAVLVKLDPKHKRLKEAVSEFSSVGTGGVPVLQCPWCHKRKCSDRCLVKHGVSSEVVEKVSRF